jgi:hypothetical protein
MLPDYRRLAQIMRWLVDHPKLVMSLLSAALDSFPFDSDGRQLNLNLSSRSVQTKRRLILPLVQLIERPLAALVCMT